MSCSQPSTFPLNSAQTGGVSSYMGLFYSRGAVGGPAAISKFTLGGLNNSPMFNPLSSAAVIPTLPSTGIVPNGAYLAGMSGGSAGAPSEKDDHLRALCNKSGLSCRDMNGKYLPRRTLLQMLGMKEHETVLPPPYGEGPHV
jgi:hypothetical protein